MSFNNALLTPAVCSIGQCDRIIVVIEHERNDRETVVAYFKAPSWKTKQNHNNYKDSFPAKIQTWHLPDTSHLSHLSK
jgi:hypothetical protein